MQQREKVLAGVVAALLLIVAGRFLYGGVAQAFAARDSQLESLQNDIRGKQRSKYRGLEALERLEELERRSLPADRDLARTLYQNWLLQLVDGVQLANANVEPGRGAAEGSVYYKLPFTIRGHGSIDQVVRLMHGFYRTDYLHMLRDVTLRPLNESKLLEVRMTVEALVLPGAEPSEKLSAATSRRLAWDDLSSYASVIVDRNVLAEYQPPPPPRRETPRAAPRPEPPAFDPSRYTLLSAVVGVGPTREAWFIVRTTGEVLRVKQGELLEVGPMQVKIAAIADHSVLLETPSGQQELMLGQRVSDAAGEPASED